MMAALGGTRFWYGPALGAVIVTTLTQSLTGGERAVLNRALIGAILIIVIVFLPDGVAGGLRRAWRRAAPSSRRRRAPSWRWTPSGRHEPNRWRCWAAPT